MEDIETIKEWLQSEQIVDQHFLKNAIYLEDDVLSMSEQADIYPQSYFYKLCKNSTGINAGQYMFTKILQSLGYRVIMRRFYDMQDNTIMGKAYRHDKTHKEKCLLCGRSS